MSFNWQDFLRSRGIGYSDSGPNVAKGNIVCHCPFCGSDDEGMHLSVSLDGRGWRCWRRPSQHKGANPTRLVQALLGCSWETARGITGSGIHLPDDFMSVVNNCLSMPVEPDVRPQKAPKEFLPLSNDKPSRRLYMNYLAGRGFSPDTVEGMTDNWGMFYCSRGPYKGRIIFTVMDKRQLLHVWTGRTIYAKQELRYKTLSTDPEKSWAEGFPPAVKPITHYLLWQDKLKKADADTIVLVEGPFDALKVNVLGRKAGIVSTCFFTSQPSEEQTDLLHALLPRFRNRILLLDANTTPTSLWLSGELNALGVRTKNLPKGVKDPGDLTTTKQLSRILL